jgi:hypothetical protein
MKNQTEEQKDHFSSDRNHWCIVKYTSNLPMYYAGYFGAYSGQTETAPAFTSDFNKALKLHSRIAADELFTELKRHTPLPFTEAKVEDHRWM